MSWWHVLLKVMTGAPPRRARHLSAAEAERLLRGESAAADRGRLAAVLAAVTSPTNVHGYPGRAAALEAFRQARQEWSSTDSAAARTGGHRHRSTVGRGPVRRSAKIRLRNLAISAAAVSIVAAAAVAASGQLPAPAQHSVHGLLTAVGLPVPDAPHASGESRVTPPKSAPRATAPAPVGSSAAAASPVQVSLCQTYLSTKKPGKGMAAADLDRLVQAAGTADNIDAFCAELLSSLGPTATPTATISPGTHSSTGPDSTPSCHGNGKKACPTPSG